jgi:hypothetical protein
VLGCGRSTASVCCLQEQGASGRIEIQPKDASLSWFFSKIAGFWLTAA